MIQAYNRFGHIMLKVYLANFECKVVVKLSLCDSFLKNARRVNHVLLQL